MNKFPKVVRLWEMAVINDAFKVPKEKEGGVSWSYFKCFTFS